MTTSSFSSSFSSLPGPGCERDPEVDRNRGCCLSNGRTSRRRSDQGGSNIRILILTFCLFRREEPSKGALLILGRKEGRECLSQVILSDFISLFCFGIHFIRRQDGSRSGVTYLEFFIGKTPFTQSYTSLTFRSLKIFSTFLLFQIFNEET